MRSSSRSWITPPVLALVAAFASASARWIRSPSAAASKAWSRFNLLGLHDIDSIPRALWRLFQHVLAAFDEDVAGGVLRVVDRQLHESLEGCIPLPVPVFLQTLMEAFDAVTVSFEVRGWTEKFED